MGRRQHSRGAQRNKHVYDRMSEQFHVYGIIKTIEQVRTKVKKLRQEYKKIKDSHKEMETTINNGSFMIKLMKSWATGPL